MTEQAQERRPRYGVEDLGARSGCAQMSCEVLCLAESPLCSQILATERGVRLGPQDPGLEGLGRRYPAVSGDEYPNAAGVRVVDLRILTLGYRLDWLMRYSLGDCWCTGYPTNNVHERFSTSRRASDSLIAKGNSWWALLASNQ